MLYSRDVLLTTITLIIIGVMMFALWYVPLAQWFANLMGLYGHNMWVQKTWGVIADNGTGVYVYELDDGVFNISYEAYVKPVGSQTVVRGPGSVTLLYDVPADAVAAGLNYQASLVNNATVIGGYVTGPGWAFWLYYNKTSGVYVYEEAGTTTVFRGSPPGYAKLYISPSGLSFCVGGYCVEKQGEYSDINLLVRSGDVYVSGGGG